MRNELNAEERGLLAPYEKQMKTAVEARWVSFIPQVGIDTMLSVWKSLTGSERVFRQGCGTCVLNLVVDLGTLYFKESEEKAAEAPKPKKVGKATAKSKKAAEAEK